MSSAPPAPRKRRPEEPLPPPPPRTRTRGQQGEQQQRVASVFEAMATWHMGSDVDRQVTTKTHSSKTTNGATLEIRKNEPAEGHGPDVFRSLVNLANTSNGTRDVFVQRRAALRDASTTATVWRGSYQNREPEYTNAASAPGVFSMDATNPRSRAMMAAMQKRDREGRFAPGKEGEGGAQ